MILNRVLAAITAITIPIAANAVEVVCPAELPKRNSLSAPIDTKIQFEKIAKANRNPNKGKGFYNSTLYSGHPSEMASLKPDNGDDDSDVYYYSFNDGTGLYISCDYYNSSYRINYKLLKPVAQCAQSEISYDSIKTKKFICN